MEERDNEKAFERLLARTLRESLKPGGADCPAPDTLAAYADRQLSDAEASRWEVHFSQCARCQHALGALAMTEVEPVADLAVAAAAAAPQAAAKSGVPSILSAPEKDIQAPRRFWSWRWLAPALATAAAVALWIAIRPAPHVVQAPIATEPAAETQNQIAQNNPQPAPGTEVPSDRSAEKQAAAGGSVPAAPAAEAGSGPAAREESGEPANTKKTAPAPVKPGRGVDTLAAEARQRKAAPAARPRDALADQGSRADQAVAERRKEADKAQPISGAAGEPAATTTTAATPPAPKTSDDKLARGPAALGGVAPPSTGAARKKAGDEVSTLEARPVPPQRGFAVSQNLPLKPPVIIIPPTGSVRWRVGAGGAIARSQNEGRTWDAQTSNVQADLLAGSAPSETVCWVVGREGTILRTTDGEHWEKISSPAPADWIGVQAKDALQASVFAAGHKRYDTEDGGRTWRGFLTQ
ncbi:MAG: hypothetical protein WAR21_14020 [Candidatus Acidiferrales bacterium]